MSKKIEITQDRIPEFGKTLLKMLELHRAKNQDYATDSDPMSNFTVSTYINSLFDKNRDKSFAVLIGTKLGRLATLLNSGKEPNNESVTDTMDDIAIYMILWKCDLNMRNE